MSRVEDGNRFPLSGALSGSLAVRIAGAGVAFGLHALLARLAGAEEYGAYSYVLTWVGVLAMIASLGLDVSLVKYVAAYNAQAAWPLLKGLVRWSHRLVLVLAFVASFVAALFVAVRQDELVPSLVHTVWLGCGVLPIVALLRLSEGRLLGCRRVVLAQLLDGILRPAVTAIMAALVFWLPGERMGSSDAMGLHLIALAAVAGFGFALARRVSPPRLSTCMEASYDVRTWLRAAIPLWLEAAMRLVSTSLDVILLGGIVGMTEAGVYAVANRIAELIVFGVHASQAAARPHIAASYAHEDRQGMQRAVTAASVWATVFAVATCCVLIPTRSIVLRQFGEEFVAGSAVILVLSAGYFVTACTAVVHAVMNMTDQQRANMTITAVMLAVKLPLSYAAIAFGGMIGAAVVSSSVMAAGCLWSWHHVRRTLGVHGTVLG